MKIHKYVKNVIGRVGQFLEQDEYVRLMEKIMNYAQKINNEYEVARVIL